MTVVADAEKLDHPFALAFARSVLNIVLELRRDHADCIRFARETYALCQEQGFVFWSANNEVFEGVAIARLEGREDPGFRYLLMPRRLLS